MPIEQLKDVVDYGIIGLLIFLSFITFAYAIERILFYRAVKLSDYKHKLALEIDLSIINVLLPLLLLVQMHPMLGYLERLLQLSLLFTSSVTSKTTLVRL